MQVADVQIHPTAIVEGDVSIGEGTKIEPFARIIGPVEIGKGNFIGSHCVIGAPAQSLEIDQFSNNRSAIRIGNDNVIREFTSIQRGTVSETTIGNENFIMEKCHIPHDAHIEDGVTLAPLTGLAGHVRLMTGCNLGIGVAVHQFTVIGSYAMVAMNAAVTKNLPPFSKFIPGKDLSVNRRGLMDAGLQPYEDMIYGELSGSRFADSVIRNIFDKFYELSEKSGRPEAYALSM